MTTEWKRKEYEEVSNASTNDFSRHFLVNLQNFHEYEFVEIISTTFNLSPKKFSHLDSSIIVELTSEYGRVASSLITNSPDPLSNSIIIRRAALLLNKRHTARILLSNR